MSHQYEWGEPYCFQLLCGIKYLKTIPKLSFPSGRMSSGKTYINTYDKNEHTLEALVEKLLGRSEFVGVDPVRFFLRPAGYKVVKVINKTHFKRSN